MSYISQIRQTKKTMGRRTGYIGCRVLPRLPNLWFLLVPMVSFGTQRVKLCFNSANRC